MLEFVGEKIQYARKEQNLTRVELAQRADVSARYISAIERGRIKNPSLLSVARISAALSLSIDYFIDASPRAPGALDAHDKKAPGRVLYFAALGRFFTRYYRRKR